MYVYIYIYTYIYIWSAWSQMNECICDSVVTCLYVKTYTRAICLRVETYMSKLHLKTQV